MSLPVLIGEAPAPLLDTYAPLSCNCRLNEVMVSTEPRALLAYALAGQVTLIRAVVSEVTVAEAALLIHIVAAYRACEGDKTPRPSVER
jgi:hypothetical protein